MLGLLCVAASEGAVALGLNRVVFESDSQILVSTLLGKNYDLSVIGVLLKEIRNICIGSFESFTFHFVPRDCNRVAHSLSQFDLRVDTTCVGWEGDVPDFVSFSCAIWLTRLNKV
jgi:hypothetical protein